MSAVARRAVSLLLIVAFFTTTMFAGLGSDKSMYVGGTINSTIPVKAEGRLNVEDTHKMVFAWEKGQWELPYEKVTSLAYGQHAGRRVGQAIALGVLTWGIGGLAALSKKRRHYLTIGYSDGAGAPQAAIFEIGKDAIRTTLKVLEVRTGQKIEYEDKEAQESSNK